MSYDKAVSDHYRHGDLLKAIESALDKLSITAATVTIDDLAPVDEFHIGGRLATDNLIEQLNFSANCHVLDIGCGLGGAARFVSSKFNCLVSGLDLSAEYIETGRKLCHWVGLNELIELHQGSALSMPFEGNRFDGGYMLHVGMNIDDKNLLFSEIGRVLKPGAMLGVFDVMRQIDGELVYPVPWATTGSTSKLSTPEHYKEALQNAGFDIFKENNRRDISLDFLQQMRSKAQASGGAHPLGLHTLMQESTASKIQNMVENIKANLVAPIELIAVKPG